MCPAGHGEAGFGCVRPVLADEAACPKQRAVIMLEVATAVRQEGAAARDTARIDEAFGLASASARSVSPASSLISRSRCASAARA